MHFFVLSVTYALILNQWTRRSWSRLAEKQPSCQSALCCCCFKFQAWATNTGPALSRKPLVYVCVSVGGRRRVSMHPLSAAVRLRLPSFNIHERSTRFSSPENTELVLAWPLLGVMHRTPDARRTNENDAYPPPRLTASNRLIVSPTCDCACLGNNKWKRLMESVSGCVAISAALLTFVAFTHC